MLPCSSLVHELVSTTNSFYQCDFFLQQLEEFTNLNDLDSEVKKEQVVPSQSEDESITYVLDTETGQNFILAT